MRRYLLICICFFAVSFLPFVRVLASGFQLKTVGSLNIDGVTYSHLWYTNENVAFTGIGCTGNDVTVNIDGTTATASVDASGNWSYSTNLSAGDHQISFTSGAGSVSFTLTIGTPPEGVGSLTPSETPTVGNSTPTLLFLASGCLLIGSAIILHKRFAVHSG
jgi:hypothetical protein